MLDVAPITRAAGSGPDPYNRSTSDLVARPVQVDLPGRAVEPVDAGARVSDDASRRRPAADDIDRGIEIDMSSQQVIFKAIERRSGEIVRQVPEEVVLKVRAYARTMRGSADDLGSELAKAV
jgi:hypothetical protein